MHSLHSDDEQQTCAHDFCVNAPRSLQSLFYGITIHSAKVLPGAGALVTYVYWRAV